MRLAKVSVSGEVRAALVEDDQLQILETCDLGSALALRQKQGLSSPKGFGPTTLVAGS